MKNFLQLTLFLLLSIGSMFNAVKGQNSMIIRFNDGSTQSFILTDLRKVSFSGSNMLFLKTNTSLDSCLISNVGVISFGIKTRINETTGSNNLMLFPNPADKFICLKNIPEGELLNVSIFSLDGIRIIGTKLRSNSSSIDVSSLGKGLYLLKANGYTLKFLKQ